jgi:hypothetical protein
MAKLFAFVIKSRNVKTSLDRVYLRQKNYSCLHVYIFNSVNDFVTFRYQALAVFFVEKI